MKIPLGHKKKMNTAISLLNITPLVDLAQTRMLSAPSVPTAAKVHGPGQTPPALLAPQAAVQTDLGGVTLTLTLTPTFS